METCVPVRFEARPKHHLATFRGQPPATNAQVVVVTREGPRLAVVRGKPQNGQAEMEILRLATPEDLSRYATLKQRAEAFRWRIKSLFRSKYPGVKIVGVEYTLDGAVLFVRYHAERKVRLGAELKRLARESGARIELVALGARDEVAEMGAIGACGMETCCSTWMQDFGPTTIRMARDQQLPLSPEKISGPCGRLLCCIAYEHPIYKELLEQLPKKNARVCTKSGMCGKVAKLHPLSLEVEIKTTSGSLVRAKAHEVEPWQEDKA